MWDQYENLTVFMRAFNINRTQLARGLNVDRRTVYNWERSRTGISFKTARRWCEIFGELPPFLEVIPPHSKRLAERHRENQKKRLEKFKLRHPDWKKLFEEMAVKCNIL